MNHDKLSSTIGVGHVKVGLMKNKFSYFRAMAHHVAEYFSAPRVLAWVLITQLFFQNIAFYPVSSLVGAAHAQDVVAPTSSPSPASTVSPTTTTAPLVSPTPTISNITPSAAAVAPTTLPSRVPTTSPTLIPTTVPKATITATSPTITISPTTAAKVADSSKTRKRVVELNTSSNKKKYVHNEKAPDTNEEPKLRTEYAKAIKVSEKQALQDEFFDKKKYESLKKQKKTTDSNASYVAPKNERIKDALLGTRAAPTPTPMNPFIDVFNPAVAKGQTIKSKVKAPTPKATNVPTEVSPTPYYPTSTKNIPQSPVAVEQVIEPAQSNVGSQTASINSQGQIYRMEISTGEPIHYKDTKGEYKEVDTNVVVDETEEYSFRNAAGAYIFRAAKNLFGGVEFTNEKGKICRFGLSGVEGVELRDAIGVADKNKVIYKNIYPNADLEFTLTGSGVRTEIVAKNKSARKSSYQFDLYSCELDFQKPQVVVPALGVSVDAIEQIKDDRVNVEKVQNGTVISAQNIAVKALKITPKYSDIDVSSGGLVDRLQSIVTGQERRTLSDTDEVRIDPTLSTWIYSGISDKNNVGRYTDHLYYVGTIEGREDSRTFYWFNRDSIPNASFDIIGGYMSIFQETSLGDTAVEVYPTKFGTSANGGDSIVTKITSMVYPGLKSALPDLVSIDSTGTLSSNPADKTGIPQYKDGGIVGSRRIHVPSWMFDRWKKAPSAAEGGWVSKEGMMIKIAQKGGIRYRSSYHPDTNTRPWINVYMSSDTANPDQGRPPTIPDVYMPRSGSYIQHESGAVCDESTSPATGACRKNTYAPLVTGAGDPDGWGPGDILGVQYSIWGEGYGHYPFVHGTSPGITANVNLADNVYYWNAYSKDRTNRISGSTPTQVFVTDTTPPTVPVIADLPTFTPGVGTNMVRQVDITSAGSYDDVHVKVLQAFGTYYTIGYTLQYSASSTFSAGSSYSTPWQANNSNFNISQYGADQQSGTADDLLENTKYYFRIKARDNYGNISAWSNVASTTFDTAVPIMGASTLSAGRTSTTTPITWGSTYQDANPSKATLRIAKTNVVSPTPAPTFTKQAAKNISLGSYNTYNATPVMIDSESYLFVQAGPVLNKIKASTGTVVSSTNIGVEGFAIAFDGTHIRTLSASGAMKKIDPITNSVVASIQSSHPNANEMVYFDGAFWANRYDVNTISKIDAASGAVLCSARATAENGGGIGNIKVIDGRLWATDSSTRYVFAINPQNCQTSILSQQIPSAPIDLTTDAAGNIWVLGTGGHLVKMQGSTGVILETKSVQPGYYSVTYDGEKLWLSSTQTARIDVISATTGAVVATEAIGNAQAYQAVTDGRYIWTIHYGGGGLTTRVDTARWNEANKAPQIFTQSIATPTSTSIATPAGGSGYRSAAATIAGVKYIFTSLNGRGAVTKTRSSDATYISTIQLDASKFTNISAVAANGSTIYVGSFEGWVAAIDGNTNTVTTTYSLAPAQDMLIDLAYHSGSLWASYYQSARVSKLNSTTLVKSCDADTSRFGATGQIGSHLKVVGGNLWVMHSASGRLVRIATDCKIAAFTSSNGSALTHFFTDNKYIWSVYYLSNKVVAYDIQSGAYVKEHVVAAGPLAGVYDGSNYWINTLSSPEQFVKYNASFTELARIGNPNGNSSSYDVDQDGKYLWYSNANMGALTRIDTNASVAYAVVPTEQEIMTKEVVLSGATGSALVNFDSKTATGSAIPDGSYKASLIISDKAGQTTQDNKVLVVDNSAPNISLSNALATGWATTAGLLLQGQLATSHAANKEDQDVSSFQYKFNSGAWTAIPFDAQRIFNTTITAPAGNSTLTLRASDSTGNKTESTYSIKTDTTAPAVSSLTPVTLYAGTKPTIRFNASESQSGSNIPYGTNPKGMKVQLQYTYNSVANVKTLVDNGVLTDATFSSNLTCTPAAGATLAVENGVQVASSVSCSVPILTALPEALYKTVVWVKDYSGRETTTNVQFQLKSSIYHTVSLPEQDARIASGSAKLTGSTSRGAQLTITNTQLNKTTQVTLTPALAGTGRDNVFILEHFVVTCGVMTDTDNNPATPAEELCNWQTRVASSVAQSDIDTANTLTVQAGDGYGNNKTQTRNYVANPYSIDLSLQPVNSYFSPNGDGQLDGVVFATTIAGGTAVADWSIVIKNAQNSTIRTLSGTGSLPETITWDGKNGSAQAVTDDEYTWSAQVRANNVTFTFPSLENQDTAKLTAKSTLSDQVLIMSPSVDYVTADGVVAVAGLAPATVTATDLTQNKLKGNVVVRICVDTVGTSTDCDYATNADVDDSGNFSTLVVLPKQGDEEQATHTITAYAYDEYGNTTPISNSVTVTTDSVGSILYASATTLTPASTAEAYSAYQAGQTSIDTVANAWVRVTVGKNTQYLKLSYAPHTLRDGLYQENGESTLIGYVNGTTETNIKKNPLSDSRVKRIQATIPTTASLCSVPTGCDWYVRLPVASNQAGVYDVEVQAIKGEQVSEVSVGYKVDASSPLAPTVVMADQIIADAATIAYAYTGRTYVRSQRIRLYGATSAGAQIKVLVGGATTQAAKMYKDGVAVTNVLVGDEGIYEVDVDIADLLPAGTSSNLMACTSRLANGTCELGSFTLTPQAYELDEDSNSYHNVNGESTQFVYDAKAPQATSITATTTGTNIVSPWGRTGTPIHYDVVANDVIRHAQIARPDTFTRVFDPAASNNQAFSATFNMAKNDATASQSATMLDREGYFNPVVTLVDYAGNTTTYDAAQHATYNLGDFRGRIDDSQPLTARMPFTLWNEGGKAAYDAPLTQDSVYINTLSAGFVTRNKTIRIKAAAERGQRVQFKVNGQNHGALINVTDQNCKVPESSTPSSEATDTAQNMEKGEDLVWNSQTGEYMLPTVDRTSANGLPVRSASQCEVTTTYTFAGDGKAHQEDGTPTESVYVQLTSIDQAGNTSNITAPINIFYDTFAPHAPSIEIAHTSDDLTIRGEAGSQGVVEMLAPDGNITSTLNVKLNPDGFTEESMRLIFTDLYGTYTVRATLYDAAGNKSEMTIKTYERKAVSNNGIGGATTDSLYEFSQLPKAYVAIDGSGKITLTRSELISPNVTESSIKENSLFVRGVGLNKGAKAAVIVTLSAGYLEKKARDYNCGYLKLNTTRQIICQNEILSLYNNNKLNKTLMYYVKIESAEVEIRKLVNSTFVSVKSFNNDDIRFEKKLDVTDIVSGTDLFARSNIKIGGNVAGIPMTSLGKLSSGNMRFFVGQNFTQEKTFFSDAISPVTHLSCSGYSFSSPFGDRDDASPKYHNGVDLAKNGGCYIVAIKSGIVEVPVYDGPGYGHYVKIDHGSNYKSLYAHAEEIYVDDGDYVEKGDVIMKMGTSGNSSGVHLHFTINHGEVDVNPASIFSF